jgi:hypothetical protein
MAACDQPSTPILRSPFQKSIRGAEPIEEIVLQTYSKLEFLCDDQLNNCHAKLKL